MANSDPSVDVFMQANAEPKSSWLLLVLGFIVVILSLTIHSIVFPGQNLPVISDLETFRLTSGASMDLHSGNASWDHDDPINSADRGNEGVKICSWIYRPS